MKRNAFVGLALVALVVSSCGLKQDEIDRLRSPDRLVDAVHTQPETGATDGVVDQVYLVAAGRAVSGVPVFVADRVAPRLVVTWTGPSEITLSADRGRVFRVEASPSMVGLSGGVRTIVIKMRIAKPTP